VLQSASISSSRRFILPPRAILFQNQTIKHFGNYCLHFNFTYSTAKWHIMYVSKIKIKKNRKTENANQHVIQ